MYQDEYDSEIMYTTNKLIDKFNDSLYTTTTLNKNELQVIFNTILNERMGLRYSKTKKSLARDKKLLKIQKIVFSQLHKDI
jgi:hypothetical protein